MIILNKQIFIKNFFLEYIIYVLFKKKINILISKFNNLEIIINKKFNLKKYLYKKNYLDYLNIKKI